MLAGSRSGLGKESKEIEGTACCARADGPINSNSPIHQCFMLSPQAPRLLLYLQTMLIYRCSPRPSPARARRVITVRRPAHGAAQEGMICYWVLEKPSQADAHAISRPHEDKVRSVRACSIAAPCI